MILIIDLFNLHTFAQIQSFSYSEKKKCTPVYLCLVKVQVWWAHVLLTCIIFHLFESRMSFVHDLYTIPTYKVPIVSVTSISAQYLSAKCIWGMHFVCKYVLKILGKCFCRNEPMFNHSFVIERNKRQSKASFAAFIILLLYK